MCGFQELTGNLQDLLTQAMEHIMGQETAMTSLKLSTLTLEGYTQVSAEKNMFLFCFCSLNRNKHRFGI